MNFKDRYKQQQDKIAPDKEFLNRLAVKMNEEKKRRKIKVFTSIAAAAAAVCITLSAAVYFSSDKVTKPKTSDDFENSSQNVELKADKNSRLGFGYRTGIFSDSSMTDDSAFKMLSENLENSERVYKSESNDFTLENQLDKNEVLKLSEKIKSAVKDVNAKEEGTKEHYMAVFENGEVIKFVICNNSVLVINGYSTFYSLK